jgi:hypothetical protein
MAFNTPCRCSQQQQGDTSMLSSQIGCVLHTSHSQIIPVHYSSCRTNTHEHHLSPLLHNPKEPGIQEHNPGAIKTHAGNVHADRRPASWFHFALLPKPTQHPIKVAPAAQPHTTPHRICLWEKQQLTTHLCDMHTPRGLKAVVGNGVGLARQQLPQLSICTAQHSMPWAIAGQHMAACMGGAVGLFC